MHRYTYKVETRIIHGMECIIGRLFRDGVQVHETTCLSLGQAKASCYRHYVRLAELDEIENLSKGVKS
jgi:hypothetical protein